MKILIVLLNLLFISSNLYALPLCSDIFAGAETEYVILHYTVDKGTGSDGVCPSSGTIDLSSGTKNYSSCENTGTLTITGNNTIKVTGDFTVDGALNINGNVVIYADNFNVEKFQDITIQSSGSLKIYLDNNLNFDHHTGVDVGDTTSDPILAKNMIAFANKITFNQHGSFEGIYYSRTDVYIKNHDSTIGAVASGGQITKQNESVETIYKPEAVAAADFDPSICSVRPEPTSKMIIVDNDNLDCNNSNFANITDALDWIKNTSTLGNDNYSIEVCPGTYNEGNLVGNHYKYDEGLTIYGATGNASDVIINNNTKTNIFDIKGTHKDLNLSAMTLNCNDVICVGAIESGGSNERISFDNLVINSERSGIFLSNTSMKYLDLNNIIVTASDYGIYMAEANTVNVSNTTVSSGSDSIYYSGVNALNFAGLSLSSTNGYGINMADGSAGAFSATDITVSYAALDAIILNNTKKPVFNNITVKAAEWDGIKIVNGNTNPATFTDIDINATQNGVNLDNVKGATFNVSTLDMNKVAAGDDGIYMEYAGECQIFDTNITSGAEGITLNKAAHGFNIKRNIINSSGTHGIHFVSGDANGNISSNIIKNDNDNGIGLETLSKWDYVDIYNNCFYAKDNIENNLLRVNGVNFDINKSGNYWSDINGTNGYSNTCVDTDMDLICDTPYSVPGTPNEFDYYPLKTCDTDAAANGGEATSYILDAWESVKNKDDRKIFTKVLGSTSNSVIIASIDEATGDFEEYDGTIRVRVVDGSCPTGDVDGLSAWTSINLDGNSTAAPNITYTKLSKNARIQIEDKDGNRSCSTDSFSVRPDRFEIVVTNANGTVLNNSLPTGGPVQAAGEDFNITVAAVDVNGVAAQDFNETCEITAAHIGAGVSGTLANIAGKAFSDGEIMFTSNYSEVGIVDINITSNSEYADIDKLDGSDYIIAGASQTTGRFNPDHFEFTNIDLVDVGITNIDLNGSCVYNYLSYKEDFNTTAKIELVIEAKNKMNGTTQNYNGIYEKNPNLEFYIDWEANTTTGNFGGTVEINTSLSSIGADFINGVSAVNPGITAMWSTKPSALTDRTTPFEPYFMDISSVSNIDLRDFNVSDSDAVTNIPPSSINRSATIGAGDTVYFLYGRINPIDAKGISPVSTKIYYEIFARTSPGKAILADAMGVNPNDLNESINDVYWWMNPKHGACDNIDLSFSPNEDAGTYSKNFDHDTAQFSSADLGRIKYEIDLTNRDFLFYHPYSSDDTISTFYIEYESGAAPDIVDNVIEDEGSSQESSSRIGE